MRFRLQVEYDGSAYCGWQIQNGQETVQGEIENALAVLLRHPVSITGAGRTDSGVHAHGQIAHFDSDLQFDAGRVQYSLNGILKKDIRITGLEMTEPDFHARYDAKKRNYRYYIATKPVAMLRNYCWQVHWPLNISRMNDVCQLILGRHDFKSFCREISDVKNHYCTVFSARWYHRKDLIMFSIVADRFLHGMVRTLVGTMVDVGRNYRTIQDFYELLQARDRKKAGQSAPAKGLVLHRITY